VDHDIVALRRPAARGQLTALQWEDASCDGCGGGASRTCLETAGGREALQQSAPATAPWTPVLLAAGAEPVLAPSGPAAALAASAPAPGPGSHSRAWRAGVVRRISSTLAAAAQTPALGSSAPRPLPRRTRQGRSAQQQSRRLRRAATGQLPAPGQSLALRRRSRLAATPRTRS